MPHGVIALCESDSNQRLDDSEMFHADRVPGSSDIDLRSADIRQVEVDERSGWLTSVSPQQLDTLIVDARQLYLSPEEADGRAGLEKLWDAFERLKTIEEGKDKKAQSKELFQHITSDPLRAEVDAEMLALASIGNSFRIRHHETSKHAVPDSNARDFLFVRLANLIILLLKASDRLEA